MKRGRAREVDAADGAGARGRAGVAADGAVGQSGRAAEVDAASGFGGVAADGKVGQCGHAVAIFQAAAVVDGGVAGERGIGQV